MDSFFTAGKHANLDDALILELANIFAYDIDFAQDIQPNDFFKVLFEEYFVDGVKVGNGPIVAAEFVNNGKQYQAIRYTDGSGDSVITPLKEKASKKRLFGPPCNIPVSAPILIPTDIIPYCIQSVLIGEWIMPPQREPL